MTFVLNLLFPRRILTKTKIPPDYSQFPARV